LPSERAFVALRGERLKLAAADFNECELSRDEEAVQRHEQGDHAQLRQHKARGIPSLGDGTRGERPTGGGSEK
jgi:hypothetical protein